MKMRTSSPFIALANELGYFPTARDAREINCESAAEYARRGGKPGRVIDESLFNQCTEWAITKMMNEKARRRARVRRGK